MIALFYGTDRTTLRDKARDFFVSQNAAPENIRQIGGQEYVPGQLIEMMGAQSLFGGQEFFLLDTPSGDTDFEAEVLENVKELAESQNVFVVLEDSLLAAKRKQYEKYATQVDESVADTPERFNTFALADALAKKDKKNLWVLLQQAKAAGLRPEEVSGMLWWQLKALRLALVTDSPEEAEMKPYPYKKAKGALKNFKDGEIERLSQSLIELYHDGHKGTADMELQLEKWALSI